MGGLPGAGKTTYTKAKLPGYVHMSTDVYREDGSWPAKRWQLIGRFDAERPVRQTGMSGNKKAECVLVADALAAGRSVVVDDTNLTRVVRHPYIILAHTQGVRIRAVYFNDHGAPVPETPGGRGTMAALPTMRLHKCGRVWSHPQSPRGLTGCVVWSG